MDYKCSLVPCHAKKGMKLIQEDPFFLQCRHLSHWGTIIKLSVMTFIEAVFSSRNLLSLCTVTLLLLFDN